MLSRFFIILLFVPLLLWIFLKGDILFLLFTVVIIGVSLYEFYKMLKEKGYEVASRIGMGLGLFLPVAIYFQENSRNIFSVFRLAFFKQINYDMGGFIVFALMLLSVRQILKEKIEGAMAEISYTLFGIIYVAYLFSFISKNCSLTYLKVGIKGVHALILALGLGVFAELGDLVESKIKRELGIKDSGNILLGHGGFLDRFDSALFVLPVVYYFMKYVVHM